MDARTALPPLTEEQWQRQVTDLAELLGYEYAHFRPAQTAHGWRTPVSGSLGVGWPDLTLIRERDGRIVFVECKSDRGILGTHQRRVIDLLNSAGEEAYVWRPSYGIEAIAEVLR